MGEVINLFEWSREHKTREPAGTGIVVSPARAYIDGGCEPNPGFAAWAVVMDYGEGWREVMGGEENSTNQRAEIRAAILALECLPWLCVVELITDSQYLVNCASGAWKRKANRDLWRELDEASAPHDVTYRWVRGHDGNWGNERAHELVQQVLQTHPRKSGA